MPSHDIKIVRDGQHAIPSACPGMSVGETVRYSSPDGEVKVVFVNVGPPFYPASPFEQAEITSSAFQPTADQKVMNEGRFQVRCFVRKPGETNFIGWDPNTSPQSGGNFPVPPNKPGTQS